MDIGPIVIEVVGHPKLDGPISVRLKQPSTISAALEEIGLEVELGWKVGIWSRSAELSHLLQEGDRIEFYEALRVDPKAARRARVRKGHLR